jgi:hypothetical protein
MDARQLVQAAEQLGRGDLRDQYADQLPHYLAAAAHVSGDDHAGNAREPLQGRLEPHGFVSRMVVETVRAGSAQEGNGLEDVL